MEPNKKPITLTNMIVYSGPPHRPRKRSKSPFSIDGTSSFQSQTSSSLAHPLPPRPSAPVTHSTIPDSLDRELSSLSSTGPVQLPIQPQSDSSQSREATPVNSVESSKEDNLDCDITTDMNEHDNPQGDNESLSEICQATSLQENYHSIQRSTRESPVAFNPDAESQCNTSNDEGCESVVPESPVWNIPTDAGTDGTRMSNQHSINLLDDADLDAVTPEIETSRLAKLDLASQNEELELTESHCPDEIVTGSDSRPYQSQRADGLPPVRVTTKHTNPLGAGMKGPNTVPVFATQKYAGRNRQRRRASSESSESDDSEDDDYHNDSLGEGDITDIEDLTRPTKRKKRIGASTSSHHQPALRERANSTATSLASQSNVQSTVQTPFSQETICIRGHLSRAVSLSAVQYYCCFSEDRESAANGSSSFNSLASFTRQNGDAGESTGMSDFQTIDIEGLFTRVRNDSGCTWKCTFRESKSSPSPSGESSITTPDTLLGANQAVHNNGGITPSTKISRRVKKIKYSPEEDALIVDLQERENLTWTEIANRLPGRKAKALQVHYITKLKNRKEDRIALTRIRAGQQNTKGVLKRSNQPNRFNDDTSTGQQRYGLRLNRRSTDRYAPE
ncbi:hypothetical protein BGW36DRAFT_431187 [Talaromyces proteolyticus]|uniref:Myb-like domain-containing protein n=1 Tax=Talaromyces proteolyticus TaxID=1131652 RepID=A0AAD4PU78_9EURO|nr:uncharacterized protein BGW36DRAFT_431187 [Talaromyces proteolyticus]KAH8691945.1 hypothetical protein BGW36DRAFT_431187 [Talaromyces proteolyticus]